MQVIIIDEISFFKNWKFTIYLYWFYILEKMGKSLKAKSYLSFLLCCNNFLLPFLESLLCITVMYYNIKTVITISILYVKYKYMYQDLCIYISIGWMATTDSYITYIYIIPTINEVTQSQIKFYQLMDISSPLLTCV